jgi:hypothetical protein
MLYITTQVLHSTLSAPHYKVRGAHTGESFLLSPSAYVLKACPLQYNPYIQTSKEVPYNVISGDRKKSNMQMAAQGTFILRQCKIMLK